MGGYKTTEDSLRQQIDRLLLENNTLRAELETERQVRALYEKERKELPVAQGQVDAHLGANRG